MPWRFTDRAWLTDRACLTDRAWLTDRAQRVLVLARQDAHRLGHRSIGTEHLLLALVQDADGVAAKALESLGDSREAVLAKVRETIGSAGRPAGEHPQFSANAKRALERAFLSAQQLGHDYVGTGHMLLALLSEGGAVQVLTTFDTDLARLEQEVLELLAGQPSPGVGESADEKCESPRRVRVEFRSPDRPAD